MKPTIHAHENEQTKHRFFLNLKGGQGFAKDSVVKFAEAIDQWQIFTENDDFANFDKEKAMEFCGWLQTREAKTKTGHLSLTTQYHYLRRLKRFFAWLADEPVYRTKIKRRDVDFLRLSKKDARIATTGSAKRMPTFEEVRRIIVSIQIKSEIDMRDRAILCLALITGMRISAISTLKVKNFDKETKTIDQNPKDGVLTKNSKNIITTFFPIGWDEPERHFIDWFEHLEKKGAKPDDPIFPSTLKGFAGEGGGYSKTLVSDDFWSSSGGARKIFEKRCQMAGVPYYHPHSFRHLIVSLMSKARLTEEEKRAISLNLGHENVGTTFGSYGYGAMSSQDAVKIVKQISVGNVDAEGKLISNEDWDVVEKILKKYKP